MVLGFLEAANKNLPNKGKQGGALVGKPIIKPEAIINVPTAANQFDDVLKKAKETRSSFRRITK